MFYSSMYWFLVICIIFHYGAQINGQRRAIVHYPLTSPEESEPVSENPLSSSINSIQTGREELIAYHRGDTGSGGTYRRGYQKTTTPDYFKESITKGDSTNTGKVHHGTDLPEPDAKASGQGNRNGDKVEGPKTHGTPRDNRSDGDAIVSKDKRSSGFESPSSSTVRPSELDHSGAGRSSQSRDTAKEIMDINKGTSVRESDRRTNPQESRRQTTTPSAALNARFNTSVREGSDRNREELTEKSRHERLNRERRPAGSTETSRGQRTATRATSDKSQILTHTSASRVPDAQRYDRAEHTVSSTSSNERKGLDRPLDGRDSFRNVGEDKKDLDEETNLRDKVYPAENGRPNSTVINKPTHLHIGEERIVPASRNPDLYSEEFRGGSKENLNGKVVSDNEKPSAGGEGKIYSERPYIRDDDEERITGHPSRDVDRDYTRRHRDERYDERSYDDRSVKDSQVDRVRNSTYNSQDRTGSRSSRPRDAGYDEEYRDDVYSYRDVKDSDNIRKDRTRAGRRPYSTSGEDVDDGDKYTGGTRDYRDYSDDRRYKDERLPVDRDDSRGYRDEDARKYRDDGNRTYDDYEGTDRYRDSYNRRYEKDGESRRYGDSSAQTYAGSGHRSYDEDEARRIPSEYDKSVRRYADESEYSYNNTQRYKDDYDGYRDDHRRSSGDSGSSRRYDERDGARDSRYDDEDYKDSRSYSTRDNDRRYIRRKNEGTSSQRDDGDDKRYRGETRIYSESSLKDRYDRDNRRKYEAGDGGSAYVETPLYQERSDTSGRREYDDMNRQGENNRSGKSRGEETYRNPVYTEDEYYQNRTSTGNVDRYDERYRSRRRTGDNSTGYEASDGDTRKYTSRSGDERRRDRDRVYTDTSTSIRRSNTDDTHKDRSRGYDEDRYSDRSRVDSYDERAYVGRSDDEYTRSSRDRVRDYDTRVYRDSDEEVDTRRVRGGDDVNDRYGRDDTVRDRTADDELRKTRPSSGRNRNKDYVDRRYEDRYRDESTDGTYRYREDDERYRYPPSEDSKVEYRDTERRDRGNQRFRDDYDRPYDRDMNTPRNSDERRRGGDRSNRRDDRYITPRRDFDEKTPEISSPKADATVRGDTKSDSPSSRKDESLLKGDRSDPYDGDENRGDGKRSQARDVQADVRIPRTQYTSRSDDVTQKASVSEQRPDSLDKGDFARGRRTSFYNEDDKTDSDRDEGAKVSRDERRLSRTGESKEPSYTRNEKGRSSTYDIRQSDRPSSRPNSDGRSYSNRRESSETTRHKTKDEAPVSRVPSDLLPASDDPEYSETAGGTIKSEISLSGEETQRRRYSSTSSYDKGARRRLPSLREPEMDRPTRRDESEDSSLPENRGRYRYTKSRGDREDFTRDATSDEYIPRGKSLQDERRDMPKGEYGSPGSGTPTRSKDERIPVDLVAHVGKDEYYPSSRDKLPSRSGKAVDDTRVHRDFDKRDKVGRDQENIGRDERGMYEKGEHPRSPPHDDEKFREENITRDHFETSSGGVSTNNDPTFLVVSQTAPGARGQGSTISRSATPIPHYPDKEFMSRNTSSKAGSDKISGVPINREKRFQYDDHISTNSTSRSIPSVNDELSKRPLTTKEVIEAAYRHSDEPEKQREIFYPVYVPGSSNMTSPDVIRPSERRGITTPTKKKKKK